MTGLYDHLALHNLMQQVHELQEEINAIQEQSGGAAIKDESALDLQLIQMIVHNAFQLEIYADGSAWLKMRGNGFLDPATRLQLIKDLEGDHA